MKTILDNSNIVESYPGITLPLTTSFIEQAYYGVFRGSVRRLTGDDRILQALDENLRHMVVSYSGRVYYNLNSWYAVISLFPFSAVVKSIWRQSLGVAPGDIPKGPVKLSVIEKYRALKRVARSGKTLSGEMAALHGDFEQVFNDFYERDLRALSYQELGALYGSIKSSFIDKWEVTLANDMYSFIYVWLAGRHVKDAKRYISDIADLESMRPLRSLFDLAEIAIRSGELKQLKAVQSDDEARELLASDGELCLKMRDYILQYGDRYFEELKLESETYRTRPYLLVEKIITYAHDMPKLHERSLQKKEARLRAGRLGRLYVDRAVQGIKNREMSRMDRSRLYGMVRAIFTRMGQILYEQGSIAAPRDIHYLTVDEALHEADIDFKTVVAERKAEYEKYVGLKLPGRIVLDGEMATDAMSGNARRDPSGGRLIGTPVSTGVCEAEIVVVTDPNSAPDVKGKIVVTTTTDPGWVFLLVQAKGLIAEKGSLLSHTAIVSRELSIPAVVGVHGATSILKSGQWVKMDGQTGKIEVIEDV